MLQQTTVATVRPYFAAFLGRWPTIEALAAADDADVMAAWAGLGYYSRARNLLACARVVTREGLFPREEVELRKLPGIGAYTAAAIAAIAFDRRAVVIDGNVERVVSRLFAITAPVRVARTAIAGLADAITPDARCGDFAQAMMDLGATICVPRTPKCQTCPLAHACRAHAEGMAGDIPHRPVKQAKPERHGIVWWIEQDDCVLLVRRPPNGLLGGMLGLPGTGWDGDDAAVAVIGEKALGKIVHVFTHFRLTLDVRLARLQPGCVLPPGGEWWPTGRIDAAGLPTVFRKAAAVATGQKECL